MVAVSIGAEALKCAPWGEPAEDQIARAVDMLHRITTRPDLLAEQAGILLGFYGDLYPVELSRERAAAAAVFLVEAGADLASILYWIDVGTERAEMAMALPFGAKVAPPPERPFPWPAGQPRPANG